MIFGYFSRKRQPEIEDLLYDTDPDGKSYRYSSGSGNAYFFMDSNNYCHQPLWEDTNNLIICNGIPVNGSPENGYNILDALPEKVARGGFEGILNEIVSNVNLCIFNRDQGQMKLFISSDRSSAFNFYYRFVDSALFFSTNYSMLMRAGNCKTSDMSVYSIIKYEASPAPLTIMEDIFVVPPSHYLEFGLPGARPRIAPYFQFKFEGKESSNLGRLERILDSTASILSELNGSVLLSGGVDSTLLACKMSDRSNNSGPGYFLSYDNYDEELGYAREAAAASNTRLISYNLEERELYDMVKDIGKLSIQPFSDNTFLSTYYLMKRINGDSDGRIIVDGTGADGCFGPEAFSISNWRKCVSLLPSAIKRGIAHMYSSTNVWMDRGKVETATCYASILNDRVPGYMIATPNNYFLGNARFDAGINRCFMELLKGLNAKARNSIFEENVTILHLTHLCAASSCQKTYLMDDLKNINTVYPFLWKDMLEEQGNLSWSLKVKDGIIKYPLKKALESYMPHDFVYRPKGDFTPGFSKAFESAHIHKLLSEVDISSYSNVVNSSRYDKVLKHISDLRRQKRRQSTPLNNLIFTLIYTDQWMKCHPMDRKKIADVLTA